MDAQWKAETDARLNAIQTQLAKTRKVALALAALALALGVWGVVGTMRKPTKIVLEGRNGSLTLEASQLLLQVGPSSTRIGIDGITLRDKVKEERITRVSASTVDLSTTNGASLVLGAHPDHGEVRIITHGGGQAVLETGSSRSEMRITSLHDKGITIEATPETAKLSGIGTTFFGLGDSGLPVTSTPPATPKSP
jgi:hypothetical protein